MGISPYGKGKLSSMKHLHDIKRLQIDYEYYRSEKCIGYLK
jgi:hypothetical protein